MNVYEQRKQKIQLMEGKNDEIFVHPEKERKKERKRKKDERNLLSTILLNQNRKSLKSG